MMGYILNRTTKDLVLTDNVFDYPEDEWIYLDLIKDKKTCKFFRKIQGRTYSEDRYTIMPTTEEVESIEKSKLVIIGDTVHEMTQEELESSPEYITSKKWEKVREKRDTLLRETDWTQISDNGLKQQQRNDYKTYRATLRAVLSTYPTPDEVVWPVKPTHQE